MQALTYHWAALPQYKPSTSYSPKIYLSRVACITNCCISGDHVHHVILLGVGGVIYIPHTLVPLKSLGLDSQRAKKFALKFHAHSVHYTHKLVQTRRSLEHSPTLQTNQERSADLSARNPPDPHWPPFSFLVKGLSFPSGPFSLIVVRSFLLLA